MAWNGSGTFTRTNGVNTGSGVWTSDRDASVKITASRHDTHDQDLAAGINACLAKNGENAMTGDLNMGGNDVTNAAAGTFSGAVTASTVSDATGNVRSGRRNLLINGGFDVWQRGTSGTSSGQAYGPDRFIVWANGDITNWTRAPSTEFDALDDQVGWGLKWWGAPASLQAPVEHRIESENAFALTNKTITVSFIAKSSSPTTVSVELLVPDGVNDWTTTTPAATSQTVSLGTSAQRYTLQFTLGATRNGLSLVVRPTVKTLTHWITNLQLEPGDVATGFERLPIGETLGLCQRYFEKFLGQYISSDVSGVARVVWGFKVTKRIPPTIVFATDINEPTSSVSSSDGVTGVRNLKVVIQNGSTADAEL